MRNVILNNGRIAKVDDEDFDRISFYSWHYANGYARRRNKDENGKITHIYMHREVFGTPKGLMTDHINRDRLDNRKENLRNATFGQNSMNTRKRITPTSSYFKGVTKFKNKWDSSIWCNGKHFKVGRFNSQVLAAIAYDEKAIELFGEYARTNFSNDERNKLKIKRMEILK